MIVNGKNTLIEFTNQVPIFNSKNDFDINFSKMTNDLFNDFKWKNEYGNVIIAGGCIATCCTDYKHINQITKKNVDTEPGDIDLFLVDVKDAYKLVDYILSYISEKFRHDIITRSKNAITFLGIYPFRHVQIVLRIYTSIQQVICGFDIELD